MNIRKLTLSAMLVALGVLLGNLLYIPVGPSKCFFLQHTINIVGAVALGPVYSTLIAFMISLLRNILGTGSILAFPGSMLGAALAGLAYRYGKDIRLAILGEIVGTGLLGGGLAYFIASYFLNNQLVALFFVYPFLLSSSLGSLVAWLLIRNVDFRKILN